MTRTEVAKWLSENDNFCIMTHAGPDGDTLGTAATLCLGLRSLGKTAHVLFNPEISDKLAYLCDGLMVEEPAEDAVFVSVDVAAPYMFTENQLPFVEKIALRQAVDALPQREQSVIRLRYFHGLTQQRVARVMDISQVQVSRIEKKALVLLKALLA